MRVIAWAALREFADKRRDALAPAKAWLKLIERGTFAKPQDLKDLFGKRVDFLKNGVAIFDVGANKYRISANVRYDKQILFIRRVMTHAEYDEACKNGSL
jgi:mRNA interferase HigB